MDETEVVANLHTNHDKVINGEMPASEKLLVEIRNDLSKLECYPMYRDYVKGVVPTLAMLSESADRAVKVIDTLLEKDRAGGLSDKDLAEETASRNLIAGRPNSIRRSIDAYVRSIIRFHTLRRLSHGGSRDMQEQFVKADGERQRAHDSLLQSLRVFTTNVLKAEHEGMLPKGTVAQWVQGSEAKKLSENAQTIVVFSEQTLANERDFIKDWAIAADFDTQLQDIAAHSKAGKK